MKIIHGGNREAVSQLTGVDSRKLIDFSANINPLGLDDKLRNYLVEALKDIIYYPNPQYPKLKHSISTHFSVNDTDIFVGNGAVQMIFDTASALKSQVALVLAPTFGEYERSLKRAGAQVARYLLTNQDNFQIKIDHLLLYLKKHPKIDLICLCNPNNPTGQVLPPEPVKKLVRYCRQNDIWLILDEAFMDFVQQDNLSYVGHLSDKDPVIIIRSATKFFAIPGLRLGFAITKNLQLKEKLSEQSEPWSVNTLAQAFGEHMYEANHYIKNTYEWLDQEKTYLYQELKTLSLLTVYPSEVNYYLFKSRLPKLREKLWSFGIMIRDCSDYYGLDENYYRVAVRTHSENVRLIDALRQLETSFLLKEGS
ncbi:threonine-phosphate decarboxylase CobD [Lentilactobacillus raoultii]|uniref:threonine-phosphate decarboxylase n=1 Tax=Lentilactobacillus raoultii TaxID=1987503 RepID=A0ABW3PBI4_9LACO|nr:threonine-phosphate decarboxylase CobD [Lentilactobacillus raoultii]